MEYTRNLEYESDPDYNYLKNLFLTVLKQYNWQFDYYYDWDQVGLTLSEIKDKEKDNNINNEISKNTGSEHPIPKICNKISQLIEERQKSGDIFEDDRFVTDPEQETMFASNASRNESAENYREYSNSMTPYAYPRKPVKQTGCLPCQPKSYKKEKEKDNSCCIIF